MAEYEIGGRSSIVFPERIQKPDVDISYLCSGSTHDPRPRLRLVPLPSSQSIPQSRRLSDSSSPPRSSSSRDNSPSQPEFPAINQPDASLNHILNPSTITLQPPAPAPQSNTYLSPNHRTHHRSTLDRSDDESSSVAADDHDHASDSDAPDAEPLMASTPRYYFNSAQSPIWALQSGAEEGFHGLEQRSPSPNATPTLAAMSNPAPPPLESSEEPVEVQEDTEDDDEEEDVVVPPGFTPVLSLTPQRALPLVAIQPSTPEGLLKAGGAGRPVDDADLLTLDGGSRFEDGDYLSVIGEGENA